MSHCYQPILNFELKHIINQSMWSIRLTNVFFLNSHGAMNVSFLENIIETSYFQPSICIHTIIVMSKYIQHNQEYL